jgi:hypothetical protein
MGTPFFLRLTVLGVIVAACAGDRFPKLGTLVVELSLGAMEFDWSMFCV